MIDKTKETITDIIYQTLATPRTEIEQDLRTSLKCKKDLRNYLREVSFTLKGNEVLRKKVLYMIANMIYDLDFIADEVKYHNEH